MKQLEQTTQDSKKQNKHLVFKYRKMSKQIVENTIGTGFETRYDRFESNTKCLHQGIIQNTINRR